MNEEESKNIEIELEQLKQQIEASENEIAEMKLDRNDIMSHVKMS